MNYGSVICCFIGEQVDGIDCDRKLEIGISRKETWYWKVGSGFFFPDRPPGASRQTCSVIRRSCASFAWRPAPGIASLHLRLGSSTTRSCAWELVRSSTRSPRFPKFLLVWSLQRKGEIGLFLLRATELMYSVCGSGKGTNKEISESDVLVLVRGSQLAKKRSLRVNWKTIHPFFSSGCLGAFTLPEIRIWCRIYCWLFLVWFCGNFCVKKENEIFVSF
jgi:hypothetical protein